MVLAAQIEDTVLSLSPQKFKKKKMAVSFLMVFSIRPDSATFVQWSSLIFLCRKYKSSWLRNSTELSYGVLH